ncbi:MAG: 50S ribosomal protein L10 [Puniceicoccales bacterium]|jgi:large subunit ribosomal protein L10|nr:50S ribosomal protein L10 [Puniceicoccales bacterium]
MMKAEKSFLVKEVSEHLGKSDYVYFADFSGVTVAEISSLRKNLKDIAGECHIVKNSILKVALQGEGYASINGQCFKGHTAIIMGGCDPSGTAKVLFKFAKDNNGKMPIKGGALAQNSLTIDEIKALSQLPSIEVLRSQVLALFKAPAQQFVRLLHAVPQGMVNVLQAKVKEGK